MRPFPPRQRGSAFSTSILTSCLPRRCWCIRPVASHFAFVSPTARPQSSIVRRLTLFSPAIGRYFFQFVDCPTGTSAYNGIRKTDLRTETCDNAERQRKVRETGARRGGGRLPIGNSSQAFSA